MSNKLQCQEMVRSEGGWHLHRCRRPATTDRCFCKQHSPAAKAARREAAKVRHEKKQKNSPLGRALAKIEVLEAEIQRLTAALEAAKARRNGE